MKVYVLIENDLDVDGGVFETEVIGVYETFSQAEKDMQVLIKKSKNWFKERYDFDDTDYAEGDTNWSIWESGEYASNHIDLIIEEKEIQ